jgi:hypothetical protein
MASGDSRITPRVIWPFDLDQCCRGPRAQNSKMDWQVHYQSGARVFSAPATDRSTAIAIACILLRDGHRVVKLESTTGETIETDHVRRLCER